MPQYFAPGVYVEEVPSGIKPIAGVGTSTAGFVGVVSAADGTIQVPRQTVYSERVGVGDSQQTDFPLAKSPADHLGGYQFTVGGQPSMATLDPTGTTVTFTVAPPSKAPITGTYVVVQPFTIVAAVKTPRLCTSYSDFTRLFGDFSLDDGQRTLAHAVYGFFNNGGTRCYVMWVAAPGDVAQALEQFETIDEIAIVAAPGVASQVAQLAVVDHCRRLQDRVAIIDGPRELAADADLTAETLTTLSGSKPLGASDYATLYFPWITAYDPIVGATAAVPPSGHIAGVYARVDAQRGVYKAPANEVILGATGVAYRLTNAQQAGLNPDGINLIRTFNGNVTVWGARTLGGDQNGDVKYISVRRLLIFLRESVEQGTQWVVFEPNGPQLWARIRRNITAFLAMLWSEGALLGSTPAEAFFVRCDETTNPQEGRELGQVVTEIGVAIVRPTEFVVFRVSQWSGPGK